MPNWCDNSMRLYNEDKAKIDALEAELDKKNDEGRSMACPFNHLRPNPTGEWQYDWSCENWGTKWDADIIDWERSDENEITIYCNTAWSPPIALYDYLVEQGWNVDAIYHEGGCAFGGLYTTEGGDEYYEYDITDPESVEDLPEDIIEFGGLRDAVQDYIIQNLEEEWGDSERTEWIDAKTNPVREGYYEVTTKGWDFPQFVEWNGDHWVAYNEVTKWRGLAEDPSETTVESDE